MKKVLALVLSVAMLFCFMPAAAFADGEATQTTDISVAEFSTLANRTYTGSPIVVTGDELGVKVGDTVLKENTDYTISYEGSNTNVGTVKVIIEGKGKYSGRASTTFEIVPKKFTQTSKPTIKVPTQLKGSTGLKDVLVAWNGMTLTEGTDFTVTGNNEKAGTQTASFTFTGNYSGSCTVKYNVVNKVFEDCSIFLDDLEAEYTFDGKAKEPAITVQDGTTTLVKDKDYTVTYKNNVNAGDAEIWVVGKGTYAGSQTIEFVIHKAKLEDCKLTIDPASYVYTGSPITPTYKITFGAYELKATDFDEAITKNTEVGEAEIVFKEKAGGNFSGTLSGKFAIVGKDIKDFNFALSDTEYKYDGVKKEPVVTVKEGTTALVKDTDYTVTYENNTYAGTAKAVVKGIGKYSGEKELTFTIKGLENEVTTNLSSYTKYLTSKTFNLGAKAKDPKATFKYTSSDTKVVKVSALGDVTVVGTGKATIKVETVTAESEYDQAAKTVTIRVKPLKPVFKLSSPARGKAKIVITKVKGATKYQISYGRNGKYKTYSVKHKNNSYKTQYKTFSKLLRGKTYFIKVRAYKVMSNGTVVYGNWSATKRIKVR